jgi:hypothetical protein
MTVFNYRLVKGGLPMKDKKAVVVPLATALASLVTAANATAPDAQSPDHSATATDSQQADAAKIEPNTIFTAGRDLLGLLVRKNADGTVVAQHSSHYSHSSHSSHSSHYSSRF